MGTTAGEYHKAIEYLYSLQKFGIKFGLSKTSNLLKSFGNPHEGRKYVHVAGTNGKGSIASALATILHLSGCNVGLYTSPHLVKFNERICINGRPISVFWVGLLILDPRIEQRIR